MSKLVSISIIQDDFNLPTPEVLQEQNLAIYDLEQNNFFQLVGFEGYDEIKLNISLSGNSLVFKISSKKDEVLKNDGDPYVVFTPYMKTWKEKFKTHNLEIYYTNNYLSNLVKHSRLPNLSLSDIGFKRSPQTIADYTVTSTLIQEYEAKRNFPAKDATSRLGPHLRFGTVSIRKMVKKVIAEKNEIITMKESFIKFKLDKFAIL